MSTPSVLSTPVNSFHERLRSALEVRRVTPPELSRLLGGAVTPRTVTRWVSGETEPTVSVLRMVAPALGVSADWLVGIDTTTVLQSGDDGAAHTALTSPL